MRPWQVHVARQFLCLCKPSDVAVLQSHTGHVLYNSPQLTHISAALHELVQSLKIVLVKR